ncbi:two-component system, OmpR family, response regulator (plasmid) [Ketogulonicigenium robustum]|uniref:Two-component system, OmpR family, response regulator n=2 Tax=Ketogulonicigenium robustum TaxID=92947 RepID=A0A1W6P2Y1_9RHOB|nr:two-component system, OmpR family, response regulator [Ketogulonicigenium robustum]
MQRLAQESPDLVVLDVLLPDGSGLEVCRELTTGSQHVPVVLLTALKEEVDRIIGLEIGADDYLGKPFNPRELVARIKAVLRRVGAQPDDPPSTAIYAFAGLRADTALHTVTTPNAALVELTGAEFELLRVFLERPGRVLSRVQLMDLTHGRGQDTLDRSIDVLMSRLRRKLAEQTAEPLFKTVRNAGYQMVAPVTELARGDATGLRHDA